MFKIEQIQMRRELVNLNIDPLKPRINQSPKVDNSWIDVLKFK